MLGVFYCVIKKDTQHCLPASFAIELDVIVREQSWYKGEVSSFHEDNIQINVFITAQSSTQQLLYLPQLPVSHPCPTPLDCILSLPKPTSPPHIYITSPSNFQNAIQLLYSCRPPPFLFSRRRWLLRTPRRR